MNMSFQRLFTTVLLGALSFGCVASQPAETNDVEEQSQALEEGDNDILIISLNGLPPGIITDAAVQAEMAELAGGPVSDTTPLTDTRDGRTLLGYLATCALGDGASFVSTASDGARYQFEGHLALAPGWAYGAITASQGRWISACLLAHANLYAQAVSIDLHGAHPALDGQVAEGYDEQEAAFYGDLFVTGGAYACIGASASDPEGIPQRVCGRTEECKFTITGTCAPGSEEAVCESGSEYYETCETDEADVTMAEVITVYTRPGVFGNDHVCSHAPDVEGWPLAKSCSAVTDAVCTTDPYCCEVAWDAACVDLVPTQGP
jgi:hypothetical protein